MDQNYSAFIESVNKQNEKRSSKVWIMFRTLTCLEYYNDLTFCRECALIIDQIADVNYCNRLLLITEIR